MKNKTAEEILAEEFAVPQYMLLEQGAQVLVTEYHEQFEAIYAITDLDAEDLGSSILRTYNTRYEAEAELELIESGEHSEFFNNGALTIFEIKLPQPPKQ